MKIAIHHRNGSFSERWINYCKENRIDYKVVNAYENDIIGQLENCHAFMWHFNHLSPRDFLFAKQLLFSLKQYGLLTFPNFETVWHFDDKLGQKYLLESVGAPLIPTYTSFKEKEALNWAEQTKFPKVFKLRGGAGSVNVKLVRTKNDGIKLIKRAFNRGFKQYDPWIGLKERYLKYRLGTTNLYDVYKGVLRFIKEPPYSKFMGSERGYVYFQDFIPNNDSDIRVIVIGERAFALKRMVRKGDFRASGSGSFKVDKEEFDERCIAIAFETSQKLNSQCLAYDFVFDKNNNPLIVEVSYGFSMEAYDSCPGYWDDQLNWNEGNFIPQEWMIEDVLNSHKTKNFKK